MENQKEYTPLEQWNNALKALYDNHFSLKLNKGVIPTMLYKRKTEEFKEMLVKFETFKRDVLVRSIESRIAVFDKSILAMKCPPWFRFRAVSRHRNQIKVLQINSEALKYALQCIQNVVPPTISADELEKGSEEEQPQGKTRTMTPDRTLESGVETSPQLSPEDQAS